MQHKYSTGSLVAKVSRYWGKKIIVNRYLRETPSVAAWPCRGPDPLLCNRFLPLPHSTLMIAMGFTRRYWYSAGGEKQKPWSFWGVRHQSFSKIYFWTVFWNSLVGVLIFLSLRKAVDDSVPFHHPFQFVCWQELNSSISSLPIPKWFLFFLTYIFVFSEVSPVFLEECMMLDSKQKDHWSPFLLPVWEGVSRTGQTRFLEGNCYCNCNCTSSR